MISEQLTKKLTALPMWSDFQSAFDAISKDLIEKGGATPKEHENLLDPLGFTPTFGASFIYILIKTAESPRWDSEITLDDEDKKDFYLLFCLRMLQAIGYGVIKSSTFQWTRNGLAKIIALMESYTYLMQESGLVPVSNSDIMESHLTKIRSTM